jgi:hypothetical protein
MNDVTQILSRVESGDRPPPMRRRVAVKLIKPGMAASVVKTIVT